MTRLLCAGLATVLLAAPAWSQEATTDQRSEEIFYRAFFVDQGLEDKETALGLYRRFLDAAPDHVLAGQAARLAIKILAKAERKAEAEAIATKHHAIMAETIPAGINASFLDPDADVTRFVRRFEAESREVFKNRHALVKLMKLEPGDTVADIGAGTGFFSNLFARAVGPRGSVMAVEISPTMIHHLRDMAANMNLTQLEVVPCTERSTKLQPASVDVALICDVYHHFAHPAETMASLHDAMRPGGRLYLIDFERIPGVSRPWLLDHVRAGKDVFRSEIEAAGFVIVREVKQSLLEENYFLQFEKKLQ